MTSSCVFFFSSRRRHTRCSRDWSSDVCSSDLQLLTPLIPQLSVLMMPGLYNTQNIRADIVGVFTNCVPTDAYRGAGRPEATHGIERMVDMLAAELKMDPAEIRLKNFVTKDKFPYPTATGLV